MKIKSIIGQHIKKLRLKANMSQQKLADAAGLDRTYIASIERGLRNVSIVNIEKIAKALKLSLKNFFNDSEFD